MKTSINGYKWNWSILLPLLFFTSCFSTVPSVKYKTTTIAPSNVRYGKELANSESLKHHAEYFVSAYEGTNKGEAYWGYSSIVLGEMLLKLYDEAISQYESDSTNTFLKSIPSIENVLNQHLSCYSDTWSKAITMHSRYESSSVNFSTALYICLAAQKSRTVFCGTFS